MFSITVLTITHRDLYRAEQVEALKAQTFQDFEWIFVDDNYEGEDDKLTGGAFPLIHIPPKEIKPYTASSSALNTGLTYARGELIYFMCDYILPHPSTLQRHWDVYSKYRNVFISGQSRQVDFPASAIAIRNNQLPGYDYRMSLFEGGLFRQKEIEDGLREVFRDGVGNWWAGRNDSAPLEALLECNGFEEKLDSTYGYTDLDMGQRLMTYGLRFLLDKHSVCFEFEHLSGEKKQRISKEEQHQFLFTLINPRVHAGIYKSDNEFNLREERGKCLHKP